MGVTRKSPITVAKILFADNKGHFEKVPVCCDKRCMLYLSQCGPLGKKKFPTASLAKRVTEKDTIDGISYSSSCFLI